MRRTIKAILFDLGDTLLDFGRIDVHSLFEDGASLAYKRLEELHHPLPSFRRYHRRHLRAIHWSAMKSAITRREFNTRDVMGRLCRKMGLSLDSREILELCWLWYEPLSRCAETEAGLREMLRDFTRDGLKLAVVSNTFVPGEVLDQHLESENLLNLLPVRVYSCDVGFRKPDRRIFAEALGRLGVEAAQAVFVGDSPKADIRGANGMDMVSVLKDRRGRYTNSTPRATHRIQSILELPSIIARYNG